MKTHRMWLRVLVGVCLLGGVGYATANSQNAEVMAERERIAVYKKQRRTGDLKVGDDAPDAFRN